MHRYFLSLSCLFLAVSLQAATPLTGYVQTNPPIAPQPGGFNISSGTVGTLSVTGLAANQCVQTAAGGLLTVTGTNCGAGGGGGLTASTLATAQSGVLVTSPTVGINFIGPPFIATAVGSTATITLNPSSVTLQGQNVINLQSAPQAGAVFNVASGTVAGNLSAYEFVPINSAGTQSGGFLGLSGTYMSLNGNGFPIYLNPGTGQGTFVTNGSSLSFNSSNGVISIIAPSSQATTPNYYTLPSTNGVTGQALTLTNNTGTMAWSSLGVLQSSGVAFGSPTNGITSDTNTFSWDNTNKSLLITGKADYNTPLAVNATGVNSTVNAGIFSCNSTAGTVCRGLEGSALDNGGISIGVYGHGIGPTTNYGVFGAADGTATTNYGGVFFAANGTFNHAMTLGPGDLYVNSSAGTAGQFLQSQGANNVPSWATISSAANLAIYGSTGTNTTTILAVSSPTSAMLFDTTNFIETPNVGGSTTSVVLNPSIQISTVTFLGSGNATITETGTGVVGQIVLSTAGTGVVAGHCAAFGSSMTIIDAGAGCGTGSGGGNITNNAGQYSVPYYSAAGSSNTLSGSTNFQWNGTSVTVVGSSVSIRNSNVASLNTVGLLDVYLGTAFAANGPLLSVGSLNVADQLTVTDQQFVRTKYGIRTAGLNIDNGQDGKMSSINAQNFLNLWNNGEIDIQSDTSGNGGANIVLLPNRVAEVTVSSLGVTISTLTTIASGASGTYSLTVSTLATGGKFTIDVSTTGHLNSQAITGSTVTSCGTTPSFTGSDIAGTITTGSGSPTACTLTFSKPFTNTPVCVVSDTLDTAVVQITSISNTNVVFGFSAALNSGKILYICVGSD